MFCSWGLHWRLFSCCMVFGKKNKSLGKEVGTRIVNNFNVIKTSWQPHNWVFSLVIQFSLRNWVPCILVSSKHVNIKVSSPVNQKRITQVTFLFSILEYQDHNRKFKIKMTECFQTSHFSNACRKFYWTSKNFILIS